MHGYIFIALVSICSSLCVSSRLEFCTSVEHSALRAHTKPTSCCCKSGCVCVCVCMGVFERVRVCKYAMTTSPFDSCEDGDIS